MISAPEACRGCLAHDARGVLVTGLLG